jgi:hypothetical protein
VPFEAERFLFFLPVSFFFPSFAVKSLFTQLIRDSQTARYAQERKVRKERES